MNVLEFWAALAHQPVPEDTPANRRACKRSLIVVAAAFIGLLLMVWVTA